MTTNDTELHTFRACQPADPAAPTADVESYAAFTAEFVAWRKNAGLSQRAIAAEFDVSPTQKASPTPIAKAETGVAAFPLKVVDWYAAQIGEPVGPTRSAAGRCACCGAAQW